MRSSWFAPLDEQAQHQVRSAAIECNLAGGKLRVLAVSGSKRSRYLPGVPTFAESGFPGVAADEYFDVFAPTKMPQDLVLKLNAAIRTALKSKAMIDGLEKLAFEVSGESTDEFTKIVKSEITRWGPVVKASGFSSED